MQLLSRARIRVVQPAGAARTTFGVAMATAEHSSRARASADGCTTQAARLEQQTRETRVASSTLQMVHLVPNAKVRLDCGKVAMDRFTAARDIPNVMGP
jgi:hypothetical protein